MLRKLVLVWVIAAGSVGGFSAAAQPAHAGESVKVQFQVLVQNGSGWRVCGTYPDQSEARRNALRLWQEGNRVLIQEVEIGRKK
ncbi:hypothetical protein GobsT_71690 [Gemmata obscuriglobus]|uniref:hypothetical protein n=1 Tax=Gemmata obscuriglobus TaxID=114 RepID=UPI0011CD254C|nr:hypothetical protein [Gemmata obscuriglobus]QEG32314.1 hypothetical protein GobsT_71690 [Gemmata obscuriglobus]VTS11670.1 unnamed protein product [Gemmata obscuriglobus UQM 2246]